MGTNTMTYYGEHAAEHRVLLVAASEDDALDYLNRRHPQGWIGLAFVGQRGATDPRPYDRLAVTAKAFHLTPLIRAALTRVKEPDGLTPGQRLGVDEALRDAS